MSLANLTLQGMDRYGAIELRSNADRSVARGFLTANLLLGSLFLFYSIFPEAKSQQSSVRPVRLIGIFEPPPAIKKEVHICAGFAVPPIDAIKPVFGIPVPVPNSVAPNMYLPDINLPIVPPGTPNIIGTGVSGQTPVINVTVKNEPLPPAIEDDPEVFKSVDKNPVAIIDISSLIVYPEIAKRSGLEGKVIISAYIDTDGKVIKTRVEMADYEVFKQAAIDAIMKTRFTPALIGDEPVRLWYTVPISFKLTQQ